MNSAERLKYIGGSDIAGIMGQSRWSSPLEQWAVKTGRLAPKDLSDIEAVEIGAELEDYVSRKFMRKTGYKVRVDNRTFMHKVYPYMVGHIDRWVLGEDALLECKTTSAWKVKEWEGEEIPKEYILQVMWYLGILEKSVGFIAVLVGGQRFLWKQIAFNAELFQKMVDAARFFWETNVLADIPPLASGGDEEVLAHLFADVKQTGVPLDDEQSRALDALIEERQGGVEQKKLVEEELSRIDNQIKQTLGEYEQATTGRYGVTWKKQTQTRTDTDKLKAAGLFEEFSKTTEFRVLRTKILEHRETINHKPKGTLSWQSKYR
jgi:putative phage-type endonuclease